MSMLRSAWRSSLAAAALWALLGPAPAAPAADEPKPEPPKAEQPKAAPAEKPEAAKPAPERPEARREGERREPGARREQRREGEVGETRPRERLKRGEDAGRGPEVIEKRRHLEEQIRSAKEELDGLKPGEDDKAREIHAKIGKLAEEMLNLPGPPRPDLGRAKQRLENIKEQIGHMREEGKLDAGERLEHDAQMIKRFLERGPEGRFEGRREGPPPSGDARERIHHLEMAGQHLREAGFPEQAERIRQMIDKMHQEVGEGGPPRRDGPPPGPEGQPEGRRQPPPPGEMGPVVHELRSELQEMRRQMQEMREQLGRMRDKEKKDR